MTNSFRLMLWMACMGFLLGAPAQGHALAAEETSPAKETAVVVEETTKETSPKTTITQEPAATPITEETPKKDDVKEVKETSLPATDQVTCDKNKNCTKPCCKKNCETRDQSCDKPCDEKDDSSDKVQAKATSPTPQLAKPTKQPSALSRIEKKTKQLSAQAALRKQVQGAKFFKLQEENTQLKLEYSLMKQRQANALLKLELEKQRLAAIASLRQAQQKESQAKLKEELASLNANMQLQEAQNKQKLLQMKSELTTLTTERSLAKARAAQKMGDLDDKRAELASLNALSSEKFRATQLSINHQSALKKSSFMEAQTDIQLRELQHKKDAEISGKPTYRKDPLVNGTLYISDRRIKLTGPIITGTADYVCDRIHFFNNESKEKPIFLVIDNCPGGSVMQGYRIVKAIQSSTAPVHVVVKSFAASMAAIITTLADHSYAYPNAIILHHQLSAGLRGNITDMEQAVRTMQEWERRLAEPVANKMGLTVKEFKKQMYAHRATGDWDEFADEAVKLKWVNHVVDEIREEGTRVRPVGDPPKPWYWAFFAQDEKGNTYCKLPPLEPMDAYFIHNPNQFFRMQ